MRTTAEALTQTCDCFIVDIGRNPSPVIESSRVTSRHLYFTGLNAVIAIDRLSKLIAAEQPDVLHAFDVDSYFLARCVSFLHKIPVLLTKAGGPNPRWYFPYADHMVVFSAENKAYFEQTPKYSDARLYLIPNRVGRLEVNAADVDNIRSHISSDARTFVRVNRFCARYRDSMLQCINLINRLSADGCRCQLVLIGVVQDVGVAEEIRRLRPRNVYIFHDPRYAVGASRFIGIADFVIGTGRGVMEGASLGQVLLTPVKNQRYPALLTEDNFTELLATNFSPRNCLADYDEESNYRLIAQVCSDETILQNRKKQSAAWFERYFNIASVIGTYCDIYGSMTYGSRRRLLDFAVHSAICTRHFLKTPF